MPDTHPFLACDFHICWSTLTPDSVAADVRVAIDKAKACISYIKQLPDESLTYANTYAALEAATEPLERAWGRLNHLDSVSNNETQRAALNELLPEVSAFYSSISLDDLLWCKLKTFAQSPAVAQLDPVRQRFIDETYQDFIASGADLPAEQKSRMAEIDSELAQVTQKYSENVLDSTNSFELIIDDESRLSGLPETAIATAAQDAAANGHEGHWRITLQQPSLMPVLQYADDDRLRQELWTAFSTVASKDQYDNSANVWKILMLRQEKAQLLGFRDFADLTLQRRMAKNGATALQFVEDLHDRIKAAFDAEVAQLQAYKAAKTNSEPAPLQPWETSYWAEKQRQELYNFNYETLRPYFAVKKVMGGMFALTSQIFGITITEKDSIYYQSRSDVTDGPVEVWHPQCAFYEIHDSTSGEHLGSFYADWHPRETKRGGAWMNCLEAGLPPQNGNPRQPHLGLIIGNMTKPVGDKPALLTHSEVETIFHEFGHLLHQLLSEVPVKSLSGTNVPWDFVELPSQIMENFCWDRESLDFFARHYQTDEAIPEDLFQKLIAARNYLSASDTMRQLALGKMDLELHINLAKYLGRDLDEVEREILADYHAPLASEVPGMARRFNHLFSNPTGYAAGYYSYKWAEVLDADAFTRFQKEGVLNAKTGHDFRDKILSRGNSRPVDESFRDFMQRDPDLAALLVRSGLA